MSYTPHVAPRSILYQKRGGDDNPINYRIYIYIYIYTYIYIESLKQQVIGLPGKPCNPCVRQPCAGACSSEAPHARSAAAKVVTSGLRQRQTYAPRLGLVAGTAQRRLHGWRHQSYQSSRRVSTLVTLPRKAGLKRLQSGEV